MKLKQISEQVVVVFGATSGIGRAAAYRFARLGATVVVSGRAAEALEALADEINASGGTALAIPADATDPLQVHNLAASAVERFGRLDTWVQLAGIGLWAPFTETTPEEWRRVIDVNLNGTAYGAMAAVPHLMRDGGALILVSSTEGLLSMPYQAAYAASKHGIHGLVKALRLELRKSGAPVSLTEVMPSGINTPLFDKARTKIGTKPMPPPPLYDPEIAADAIIHAAENVVPELIVGGAGLAFAAARRVSRGLTDEVFTRIGFRVQHTDEAKTEISPDNLDEHLPGYDQVQGSLGYATRGSSLTTWLETHPNARRALKLGAVAAGLMLVGSLKRGGPGR